MLDRRRIFMLKTGAALCNIGRGGLLDHQALAEALTAGTLSGAILDVFDPEPPPPSSLLWDVPNLIMMPHVTSDDLDHYLPLTYDLVFANAARLAAGEPLLNRVDPLLGY
jgi:glyoxylate/hydroxypyruvate reductase A